MPSRGPTGRALWFASGLAALVFWGLFQVWAPPDDPGSSLCLLRRTLVPCPGCGLTRSAAHLARGDWAAAVARHPLGPVLALEAAAAWGLWGLVLARRVKAPSPAWTGRVLIAHAAVVIALWLGRLASGTLPW